MPEFADRAQLSDNAVHTIETDVLVIGAGVSGCLAVVGAAQAGARVVVCDKGGRIERSGSVGGGVDHFFAILNNGQEWDTPEFLLQYIPSLTEGVTDLDVAEKLLQELQGMVSMLEKMGVDFHDPAAPMNLTTGIVCLDCRVSTPSTLMAVISSTSLGEQPARLARTSWSAP